jgi:hypothetical protein
MAPSANIARHDSDDVKIRSTRYETTMPIVIISWLSDTSAPRTFDGAISDR